jgi:hypothetical protein
MRLPDASALLDALLAPSGTQDLLSGLTDRGWRRLPAAATPARLGLLGTDPAATLTSAFAIATDLTFHSANATAAAPPLTTRTNAEDFRALINTLHERHYSVRFPGLRPYAPALEQVCRALEALLHKPVTASAFWSRGGMQAPVHNADHDLLVIQLIGCKRWFVARAPSALETAWERIPGPSPSLGEHDTFEVAPGDAVYLPRGTVHAVEGAEESIHVSIGFTPLTVREVVLAAVDHLSDLDRGWRTTATPFLAQQVTSGQFGPLPDLVTRAVQALSEAVQAPDFIAAALQRRSARAVGYLAATPPTMRAALTLDTEIQQRAQSFCHLSANLEKIDVAYPGGHLYIHRGAETSVLYLVNTARFRVRDIPGDVDDAVRLALATRFCDAGILEPV